MKHQTKIGALLVAAGSLGVVAAGRWRSAFVPIQPAVAVVPVLRVAPAPMPSDSLVVAEDDIASNDPFRFSNRPSLVRYDASEAMAAGIGNATANTPPRPTLVLRAIVGGPPWQAVVDGLPEQPNGAVVQPGARFGGVLVRSVTRDSVVVQSFDTTLVLSFRKRL